MYEMVKDDPKFKRFCARQSTRPVDKPKRFKVPIPKPKGKWSILGSYTTGRLVRDRGDCEHADCPDCMGVVVEEVLYMKSVKGEIVSEPKLENVVEVHQSFDWEFGRIGDCIEAQETAIEKAIRLLEEQNNLLKKMTQAA